ncbi:putative LOC102084086 [Columba livia]|uniref:Putative LOC102084086 n=1 Tax=Columba livia TaxID=8932 RepID=A0A2I0MLY2_COLLI|nr:putative LOC102084086 [Columba livia]
MTGDPALPHPEAVCLFNPVWFPQVYGNTSQTEPTRSWWHLQSCCVDHGHLSGFPSFRDIFLERSSITGDCDRHRPCFHDHLDRQQLHPAQPPPAVCGPPRAEQRGRATPPRPTGNTLSNAAQETVCCLCHKGMLLAQAQLGVHQVPPKVLFRQAAPQLSQHVLVPGVVPPQVTAEKEHHSTAQMIRRRVCPGRTNLNLKPTEHGSWITEREAKYAKSESYQEAVAPVPSPGRTLRLENEDENREDTYVIFPGEALGTQRASCLSCFSSATQTA